MDILAQFILAFIAASIGFLIHRVVGFNVVGFFSAIPLIFLLMPLLVLTLTAPSLTTTELVSSLTTYLTNFTAFLPSLVIGHVAGALAGAIFGNNGVFGRYQFR